MRKLSQICNYAEYTTGVIDGYVIIRDCRGDCLDVDDLKQMIDSLNATVKVMETHGYDGNTIVHLLEKRQIKKLFESRKQKDFIFYPTSRKQLYGKGSGVYFVGDSLRPERVKIGMSSNVTTRTKGLEWHVDGNVEIYAIILTPDYKICEAVLHDAFAQYRIDGEWFQKEPVLAYVNSLMEEYRK